MLISKWRLVCFPIAWYDYDLKSYQRERQEVQEGELFRKYDEKKGQTTVEAGDLVKEKFVHEIETDWQQELKRKKNEEYYKSLREVSFKILKV